MIEEEGIENFENDIHADSSDECYAMARRIMTIAWEAIKEKMAAQTQSPQAGMVEVHDTKRRQSSNRWSHCMRILSRPKRLRRLATQGPKGFVQSGRSIGAIQAQRLGETLCVHLRVHEVRKIGMKRKEKHR